MAKKVSKKANKRKAADPTGLPPAKKGFFTPEIESLAYYADTPVVLPFLNTEYFKVPASNPNLNADQPLSFEYPGNSKFVFLRDTYFEFGVKVVQGTGAHAGDPIPASSKFPIFMFSMNICSECSKFQLDSHQCL